MNINDICSSCENKLKPKVLQSAAGYYIGTFCSEHGPYARWSGDYYRSIQETQTALETLNFTLHSYLEDKLNQTPLQNYTVVSGLSILTGKRNAMLIPLTLGQIERYDSTSDFSLISLLNSDQREFMRCGITPKEWDDKVESIISH